MKLFVVGVAKPSSDGRVLEDAADGVHGHLAHARVAVAREEVLAAVPEREVDVHPRAVVAEEGLGHEGDDLAVFLRGVLRHVFVLQDVVRHRQERVEAHVDLGLPGGRDLVVLDLDGDADRFQGEHHVAADVLQRIGGRHREIAFLEPDLVTQVSRLLDPARVPPALGRIDMVVALVLVLVVADVVENEEFALGAEIRDFCQARLLQVGLGLAGDIARVAGIVLAGDRIADIADHHEGLRLQEGIDEGRVGHGLDEHVALVDRLPAPDARAVEAEALLEGVLVDLVGRHGKMLPLPGEVHEAQVDHFDFFFLNEGDDVARSLAYTHRIPPQNL